MKTITITTGFGYFVDKQGHKIAKAELPMGDHPCEDAYIYIEVANKQALSEIELYVDAAEIERQQNEQKIQVKIRQMAIDSLIESGDLPPDYK